jgi:hypothetical protein
MLILMAIAVGAFILYIDYFVIAMVFVPAVFLKISGVTFSESDLHDVFKILITVIPLGIWWALNNLIHFNVPSRDDSSELKLYPFKWVGIVFCGVFFGYLARSDYKLDMIWSITIGLIFAIICAVGRHYGKKILVSKLKEHIGRNRYEGEDEDEE